MATKPKPKPAAGKTFKWKGSTTPHTVPYKQWATHHPQKAAARTKALKAAGKLGGGKGAGKGGGGGGTGTGGGRGRRGTPWQQKPVVPGSSVTRGELNQEATATLNAAFGPQQRAAQQELGSEQQFGRDIPDFYRQYQQSLQQHATNIANYQAGAQAALGQIGQGITGLAGQDISQLQQNANTDAAARGTTAGNYVPTANAAAATRQALLGSFQAQQALNASAQTGAADTLANVVAPQQRLQALTQQQGQVRKARQAISDLATQRGAESIKYRTGVRETERKGVLAGDIARISAGEKLQEAGATRRATAEQNRLDRQATARQKEADRKNAVRLGKIDAGKSASKRALSGPFAGLTSDEIGALGNAGQKQRIDAFNAAKNKGKGKGKQPTLTLGQQSQGLAPLPQLKDLALKAKAGRVFEGKQPKNFGKLDRHGATSKIYAKTKPGTVKNPILLTAVMDAVYDGHLSGPTEARLRQAGYKSDVVARTLGTRTHKQWIAGAPQRNQRTRTGRSIATNIPGFGQANR